MFDTDGQASLDARVARGEEILRVVWGHEVEDDSRESAAKDAVSDVLTALLGPAGSCTSEGALQYDEERISEAHNLLYAALESYRGDAEDYVQEDVDAAERRHFDLIERANEVRGFTDGPPSKNEDL